MEIKYHLDESVSNAVANGLNIRGINVTTSKVAGLIGASDLQQLAYARGKAVYLSHMMMTSFESMLQELSTLVSSTFIRNA